MGKKVISTPHAPGAIGPYSQAIRAGGFLFLSGQVGLDPATGSMASGGVEAETRQCLRNLAAVLAAAGAGLDAVVKTTLYLVDLGDFEVVNRAYGEFFPGEPPARATVGVSRLPRDARIEIEAVARLERD